ncbi:MAG: signal peptidase I [Lactobacillales bacterium]|jgi:signal peptidase I|nr:signal peptidase I [Lactobacillales bacterium]
MKKFLKEWGIYIALVIVVIFLRFFVFPFVNVDGHSMDPTLENKDRIVTYRFAELQRFDIVVATLEKKKIIKRLIGMPGDKVHYDNDQLYINDKKYGEPYLDEYKKLWKKDKLQKTFSYDSDFQYYAYTIDAFTVNSMKETKFTINVPKGKYLLLGDNRPVSKDGRVLGSFSASQIDGKAKFIFWPPRRFGMLKNGK